MGDVVQQRKKDKENKEKVDDLMKKLKDIDETTSKMVNLMNEDPITLHGILEIIDGMIEQPGRVIGMCTNFPEKLDSALLRPGRIEFKYASTKIIKQMLNLYYDNEVEQELKEELNYKYSQSTIVKYCFENDTIDKVIKALNDSC